MTTKSTKKKATDPNGKREIDVSAIEWGAPEPRRIGQWHKVLAEFAERPGEAGLVPGLDYTKKYLSVLASDMRNKKNAAKDFEGHFDVRVAEADDGSLGLWIKYEL